MTISGTIIFSSCVDGKIDHNNNTSLQSHKLIVIKSHYFYRQRLLYVCTYTYGALHSSGRVEKPLLVTSIFVAFFKMKSLN